MKQSTRQKGTLRMFGVTVVSISEKLLSTNHETALFPEAHSELFQTSKMEHSEKIVNS